MTKEDGNKLLFAVVVIGLAICVLAKCFELLSMNGYL